jgi:hypothetical protein
VRNFLIDKLKSAETEIKSLMAASSALKKQAVSDQEVCEHTSLSPSHFRGFGRLRSYLMFLLTVFAAAD